MESLRHNIMAVSNVSYLATMIICVFLSESLTVHGGKSKESIRNLKSSGLQQSEENLVSFSAKSYDSISPSNDAYARYLESHDQQYGNSLQYKMNLQKVYHQQYGYKPFLGSKKMFEKMLNNVQTRALKHSLGRTAFMTKVKRRKRSASNEDKLEHTHESERNESNRGSPIDENKQRNKLPDTRPNSRTRDRILTPASGSGSDSKSSDDSSPSLLVYILPAILVFLIITLVITLLMYRVQKRKTAHSIPKRNVPLPGRSLQDSVHSDAEGGEEAIELVDFAEYHPSKERELMAGFVDTDEHSREPLMSLNMRSSGAEATIDFHDTIIGHAKRTLRANDRASEKVGKEFQRQDSPNSPARTEDEMGPLEKIYISIPPRPPSENYIEATSTSTSVSSTKSVSIPKLEWLTKDSMIDAKNEASSYHSDVGTQTVSSIDPLSSKTVFGTPWYFGGTFTKKGGVLQAANSDVSLTLVPHAVTTKDYVTIYGAVFTETQDIRKKFNIQGNEILITPLVEYHTSGNYKFSRHVKINLPHALPEDSNVRSLKVYGFSVDKHGRLSVQIVPYKKSGNACWDEDCFWELQKKDQNIQIWTLHFSGYFCTSCESKSRMSSVCARIFGSHVKIKSKRREIRMIMYIWDRRLNIRDFLQRIVEQECDMDRQLLADQQIPLLENATSDSHVVMKMDTLGDEEDRICWSHVMRPNARRPLFKPLQVRKLFQIIHCCQQSDPLRVEWAMENMPSSIPSSVFQCCIDVLHVPESTTNFEQALEDADEDYMRTFYVRDLPLSEGYLQSNSDMEKTRASGAVMTLAKLNRQETESICEAFGLAKKDIGNLSKKFSTDDKVKHGLIEECCRRVGQDRFLHYLPEVLKQMGLSHALDMLQKKQHFSSGKIDNPANQMSESSSSCTKQKQCLLSPLDLDHAPSNFNGLQKQISEQSNEVFYVDDNPSHHYGSHQVNVQVRYPHDANEIHHPQLSRQSSQSLRYYGDKDPTSLPLSSQSLSHKNNQYLSQASQQGKQRQIFTRGQTSYSSGSDSALRGNSINSSDVAMSTFDFLSMEAQADSKEFREVDEKDELEEFEEETFKKEVAGTENKEVMIGFPEIKEETLPSNHGPVALSNLSNNNSGPLTGPIPSLTGPIPSNNKTLSNGHSNSHHGNQRSCQSNSHSNDCEETLRKESYETIV